MIASSRTLHEVEKWTSLLAALLIAAAAFLASRQVTFSVAIGAALMAVNAWVIRRVGERLLQPGQRPSATILFLNFKMMVLGVILFGLLRILHLDPVGLIVGVSALPAGIIATAIKHAFELKRDPSHG